MTHTLDAADYHSTIDHRGGRGSSPRSGIAAIEELSQRPQWVAWRSEAVPGREKATKIPINPQTGRKASVADPSTWGSCADAEARARDDNLAGIGYVLTEDDGLTGVDLDKCIGEDGTIEGWAADLLALSETYAEVSPSGRGIRMFALGKTGAALKSDPAGVEVYDRGRYLTVTRNHIAGTPDAIRPAPATLGALRQRVDAFRQAPQSSGAPKASEPPRRSSEPRRSVETGETFFGLVNSRALENLARWVSALFGAAATYQQGTGAYRVPSRRLGRNLQEDLSIAPNGIVDFGVHDMGDRRDGKRSPIDLVLEYGPASDPSTAALWLCEKLGVDPESLGWRRRGGSAAEGAALAAGIIAGRSSEEEPRYAVGDDGSISDSETGEEVGNGAEASRALTLFDGFTIPLMFTPRDLKRVPAGVPLYPPGGQDGGRNLVGKLAHWINQTARRPLHPFAIGAALVICGTAMGRRIGGPTKSGTHLYVVGLAPTGAGKDHPLDCCRSALYGAGLGNLRGGSEFMSMPAVINAVSAKPLSLWPMDEFGAFLGRVQSRQASGFERGISKILRSLWGSSFKLYSTPEWAARQAVDVHAPALSIFGVSTPPEFFAALGSADLTNGLLNRMLLITGPKVAERDPVVDPLAGLPGDIVAGLRHLHGEDAAGNLPPLHVGDMPPAERHFLEWGQGGKEIYDYLGKRIEAFQDANPADADFFARTAEMAVRIATIIAAGDGRGAVAGGDMTYGALIAIQSANEMLSTYHEQAGVGEHGERVKMVEDEVRRRRTVARQNLTDKFKKKMDAKTLDGVLRLLVDSGVITEEIGTRRGQRGPRPIVYRWSR